MVSLGRSVVPRHLDSEMLWVLFAHSLQQCGGTSL